MFTGAKMPFDNQFQFSNSLGTDTPSPDNVGVTIDYVPSNDPPGPGPLMAAKFDGSSFLNFGADNTLYNLDSVGTISLIVKPTEAGHHGFLVGYGGEQTDIFCFDFLFCPKWSMSN